MPPLSRPPVPIRFGVWALLALLAACAGTSPTPPALVPDGDGTSPPDRTARPWELPHDAYPTQRLYRLHVESSEDDGTLRMTLRLETPVRYRLVLADRLGRNLFTLDVGGNDGWLLDHREQRACRLVPGLSLRGVALDPLSLLAPAALPALLLGRVPATPGGRVERTGAEGGAEGMAFRDAAGRRWTVVLRAGRPVGWTRWTEGRPVLWWQRTDGEALLSDRERGFQMRWRQTAAEPMETALPPVAPPPGFERVDCSGDGGI